jgi:hypothetical protein
MVVNCRLLVEKGRAFWLAPLLCVAKWLIWIESSTAELFLNLCWDGLYQLDGCRNVVMITTKNED